MIPKEGDHFYSILRPELKKGKNHAVAVLPCGPSMMDCPETSGNLRKLAAEVSDRFPAGFW